MSGIHIQLDYNMNDDSIQRAQVFCHANLVKYGCRLLFQAPSGFATYAEFMYGTRRPSSSQVQRGDNSTSRRSVSTVYKMRVIGV